MDMRNCHRFEYCSAPLCPLDAGLANRVWYHDEEICKAAKYNKHRWIKKQRSIVRRQTKSYLDKPITYQLLYDNSRPRQLTVEQRAAMAERMAKARQPKVQKAA